MKAIEQVFDLFLSKHKNRNISAPFISTKYVCATDVYSLIYADKDKFNEEIQAKASDKTPKIEDIIAIPQADPITFSIADLERELDQKCEKEDEYTILTIECRYCDGQGYQECNLGHDHECNYCDGSGYSDSPRKTGNKVIDSNTIINIIDDTFYYKQIGRLITACKLLGVDTISKVGFKQKRHLFTAGDINFIIMPVATTEHSEIISIELI